MSLNSVIRPAIQALEELRELKIDVPPPVKNRHRDKDKPLAKNDRVEHKDRGLGKIIEINEADAIYHITWDKPQSYNDGSMMLGLPDTTTTHSWVGGGALTKIHPTYSLYEDLDYAGFPPGWKQSFMKVWDNRVEELVPLVQKLIAENKNRSEKDFEQLTFKIFALMRDGDGNAVR